MARELNMDTQRQNFWKESIYKEATVRLAWHMRFSKEFAEPCIQQSTERKKTPPKVPHIDALELSKLEKNYRKSNKKHKQQYMLNEKPTILTLVEMRPVSAKTRHLLFKGFSALGEGRYAYLQARKQKKPEEKYEFPMTSGWEYGWRIKDAMKCASTQPAEFGRTRIVKDSFYRRNGVMPQNLELPLF